jgi:hypothetical protein
VNVNLRAAFLAILATAGLVTRGWADPLAVSWSRVDLHPEDASVRRVGALEFRGGLELGSDDRRFGGFSALDVDPSGSRLLALTDRGHWVELSPIYAADGTLSGIGKASIGALDNLNSGNVGGSKRGDAESIAPMEDGYAVAFESGHRIWLYRRDRKSRPVRPRPLRPPEGLRAAPFNGGIEALAALADGRLLALTEELNADDHHLRGWVSRNGAWQSLRYRRFGRFVPSGAATLGNGDLLILERRFTWIGGFASRIVRVRRDEVGAGATLEGTEIARIELPLTVENFEGVAVRPLPGGRAYIYLISDDNFLVLQRTLLFMFEFRG